jgi:hypothetical protein
VILFDERSVVDVEHVASIQQAANTPTLLSNWNFTQFHFVMNLAVNLRSNGLNHINHQTKLVVTA